MASRTIDQIITDIKVQFSDTVLENAANNKGSLYIIMRGLAFAMFNQEQQVLQGLNNKLLATASGPELEAFGVPYNIIRRKGTSASGNILMSSSVSKLIVNGTTIQDPSGTLTFRINKTANVGPNEIVLPITSVSKSSTANLSGGTQLYYTGKEKIYVGQVRDPITKEVRGDLSGGSPLENDESLRTRILAVMVNKGVSTLPSIESMILNYVARVFFKEAFPASGYTTCYIDSTDQVTLDLITQNIENLKTLGTLFIIKPIQKQNVDLSIEVIITAANTSSLTEITSNVKASINSYFNTLNVGAPLPINELSAFISSVTGYSNRIIKPINVISPLTNEYLLSPNEVIVNVRST